MHGQPVAEVTPVPKTVRNRFVPGDMAGTVEIIGDIVSPVISLDEIEAGRG